MNSVLTVFSYMLSHIYYLHALFFAVINPLGICVLRSSLFGTPTQQQSLGTKPSTGFEPAKPKGRLGLMIANHLRIHAPLGKKPDSSTLFPLPTRWSPYFSRRPTRQVLQVICWIFLGMVSSGRKTYLLSLSKGNPERRIALRASLSMAFRTQSVFKVGRVGLEPTTFLM